MNQLQRYKRIMILSMAVAMVAAPASLISLNLCFAQDLQKSEDFKENQKIDENQETAGNNQSEILEDTKTEASTEASDIPADKIISFSKKFWEIRVFPFCQKIGERITNFWQSSTIDVKINNAAEWAHNAWTQKIKPFAQYNIDKTKDFFRIENRKNYLETELKKEKEEIKQESPYLYKIFDKYNGFKEFIWGANSTSTQQTNENSE